MDRFGKQLSAGTKHLVQQAAAAAQAAGASIVAGLRTCDERGAQLKDEFELRIENASNLGRRHREDGSIAKQTSIHTSNEPFSIPSTAMALSTCPKTSPNGVVWGSHNFDFSLRLEETGPSIGSLVAIARRPNTNDNVQSLDSHSSANTISIRCRWKRKIGEQCTDVLGIYGIIYPISADDFASKIIVEATSLDSNFKGIAYAEIGPFDLDPSTKKNLDNYLAVSATRFSARFQSSPDDSLIKGISSIDRDDNLMINVSTEEIKIVQPGPMNVGYLREWSCRYGADYPSIILNYNNPIQFELKVGPNPQDTLRLSTITRNQRDLLALTIRCFHGRQFVLNSALLKTVSSNISLKLSNGDNLYANPSESQSSPIDILLLVQTLNSQLYTSLDKQEKCMKERDRAQTEKGALEQDIAATIEAYQQLIAQVISDGGSMSGTTAQTITLDIQQRASHVAELETKLKEARLQSEKYIEELELLRRDYRTLQTRIASNKKGEISDESFLMTNSKFANLSTSKKSFAPCREGLESELQDTFATVELRRHLGELQLAHVRLLEENEMKDKELETLRVVGRTTTSLNLPSIHESSQIEIEEINKDKISLEKQLRFIQSENKELSDNFLYIKTKYDALKASQANVEDRLTHSNEVSQQEINQLTQSKQLLQDKLRDLQNEVQIYKSKYDGAITEVNRLSKKCESLNHELDKYRNQLENKTQLLMTVNQKLADEKSTAEEKLKKLEMTLTDQKGTIRSLETQNVSEIDELRKQLYTKDQEIERLEKENQQLKSRIRKLATTPS